MSLFLLNFPFIFFKVKFEEIQFRAGSRAGLRLSALYCAGLECAVLISSDLECAVLISSDLHCAVLH